MMRIILFIPQPYFSLESILSRTPSELRAIAFRFVPLQGLGAVVKLEIIALGRVMSTWLALRTPSCAAANGTLIVLKESSAPDNAASSSHSLRCVACVSSLMQKFLFFVSSLAFLLFTSRCSKQQ